MGIILLLGGGSLVRDVWTSDTDLTKVKGTLHSASTYVNTVTDSHGRSSQQSNLIIFLNDIKQKYQIIENIGDKYYDDSYQQMRLRLQKADSVSIWIRKSQINNWDPKVFQIKSDDTILLSANDVRDNEGDGLIMIVSFGVLCIAIGTGVAYPDKFKRIVLGKKSQQE